MGSSCNELNLYTNSHKSISCIKLNFNLLLCHGLCTIRSCSVLIINMINRIFAIQIESRGRSVPGCVVLKLLSTIATVLCSHTRDGLEWKLFMIEIKLCMAVGVLVAYRSICSPINVLRTFLLATNPAFRWLNGIFPASHKRQIYLNLLYIKQIMCERNSWINKINEKMK